MRPNGIAAIVIVALSLIAITLLWIAEESPLSMFIGMMVGFCLWVGLKYGLLAWWADFDDWRARKV